MKFDNLTRHLLEMSVINPSFLYKPVNKDENIIAAAIYDKLTGYIYTGDDHQDAYFRMIEEEQYDNLPSPEKHHSFKQTDEYKSRFVDGFYTDKDRFLDRNEALIFMRQHKHNVQKDDLKNGTELHSNVVQDYLKAS